MSYKRRLKKFLAIAASVVAFITVISFVVQAVENDVNRNTYGRPETYSNSAKAWDSSIAVGELADAGDLHCESLRASASRGVEHQLVGEVEYQSAVFQMWLYVSPYTFMPEVTISKSMENGLCGIVYAPSMDEYITERTPLEAARQLNLQYYKVIAEEYGGIEAYGRNIESVFSGTAERHDHPDEHSDEPARITSLDKWTFDQLGIELPEGTYTVIEIDDAWIYENEPRE